MSLQKIQSSLNAPKGQTNTFGNYKYRSCEDILEALKPLLSEFNYHLIISDDVVAFSDRIYIKASCNLFNSDGVLLASNAAFAREPFTKKGMDDSQITGAASSYARKYALNGLFLIDDTKDADTDENKYQSEKSPNPGKSNEDMLKNFTLEMNKSSNERQLRAKFSGGWNYFKNQADWQEKIKSVYDKRKTEFSGTEDKAA